LDVLDAIVTQPWLTSGRGTAAVSLWEQRPDAATMEPLMRGFRTQVADLSGSWPVIEEYEILADF
jgi:hypothetical protein